MRPALLLTLLVALGSLTLALAGCRPKSSFDVQGRLRGYSDDGRTMFIEHEAIPGFMDAMTMPFKTVPGATLPAGLESGDAIGFTLVVGRDSSWIEGVARIADSEVPVNPAGEPVAAGGPVAPSAPGALRTLAVGEAVPDARLIDHEGQPFALGSLAGKAYLVNFIYTRCPLPDYCPLLASRFQKLQGPLAERFGDRVRLVTVTFDPAHDTPAVLAGYRARYTQAPAEKWRFATGDSAEIARTATAFGLFRERPQPGVIDHSLITALVGPDGHLRRVWRDGDWADDDVLREVAGVLGAR